MNDATNPTITAASPASVIDATASTANVVTETPVASAPIETNTATVQTDSSTVLGGEDAPAVETTETPAPTEETKTDNSTADGQPKEGADAEVPKENTSQSDEPAPLPSYDQFAVPEGLAVDQAKLGEFTNLLGEFETTTKADHAEVQKLGQQLVDRHIAAVKDAVEGIAKAYQENWENQTKGWLEAFKADPEIGGNRQETTTKAARDFIRTFGGNADQQKEFRDLMQSTGLGNHPAMIRMLANANLAKSEGKPIPASQPVPQAKSKLQKFYGSKK